MPAIQHDLSLTQPNYGGGSIVNLMRSLGDALGAKPEGYAPLDVLPDDRLRAAQRIALVVVDGLGDELLNHIGANSALRALRAGTMTSVYPPTTASAITSFMTGLAPQQHGMTGWFMHFRKLGAVAAVLPYVPRYSRTPISEAGVDIGELANCANFFDRIDAGSLSLQPSLIADSDFSRYFCGRAERVPYETLAEFERTLERFCRGTDTDARYCYAYWSELDHLAHLHGPSSETVAEHFQAIDQALGRIAECCAESGTLLIVTADHGFLDSGPNERIELNDHRALQDMLSLPLCGEPRSAYCYVRHRAAQAFEDYVESELARFAHLVPSETLIDSGWFGEGAAHPELHARVGDYTLQMRERYTLSDRVAGERGFNLLGMHGGISRAEQIVPLLLAGP